LYLLLKNPTGSKMKLIIVYMWVFLPALLTGMFISWQMAKKRSLFKAAKGFKYMFLFLFIGEMVIIILHKNAIYSIYGVFFKEPKITEFLPGTPVPRGKISKKKFKRMKYSSTKTVHSKEYNKLFGMAVEGYITGKYEDAIIPLRRLYKGNTGDKRVKALYSRCLGKLIIACEEKRDYTTALDYIEEAEKIENTSQLKDIKKRILAKIE